MKPSELQSTGDADDFMINNIEYLLQIEEAIEGIFGDKTRSEFMKDVLAVVNEYARILHWDRPIDDDDDLDESIYDEAYVEAMKLKNILD